MKQNVSNFLSFSSTSKINLNLQQKQATAFKNWSFGTINIRSGKEKDEGAKIYMIAKEIDKIGLSFCCLQEVKYRNSGKKLVKLDNGKSYEFHWCGMKKRREAGVGFLIKVDPGIIVKESEILDPRLIAINIKAWGFNTRVVNVYSPTETESSEAKKESFYRLLQKACIKKEKHEKLIIVGDFNAKTALALKKCCYDGSNVTLDDDCNDNGTRLKAFCMRNSLCIASTYFDYPNENRYTWYSCDKSTKKVNDYVLTERYVQQYINDCIVRPDIDLDSDHRLLITYLNTPKTRKARKVIGKKLYKRPVDIKALRSIDVRNLFKTSIVNHQRTMSKNEPRSPAEVSENIKVTLNYAAENSLPNMMHRGLIKEVWKDDGEFNRLLAKRRDLPQKCDEYKLLTRNIRKRINHLRNATLSQEADEINENANRRQVEELYRNMKKTNTTFKKLPEQQQCDPAILTKYFVTHFSADSETKTPPELEDAPDFIKQLKTIGNTEMNIDPPDIEELDSVVKSLKNGKSANDVPVEFVKCAMECDEFKLEMVQLFQSIWMTNKIPKDWGHSKLVALWKGASKGSKSDPSTYRAIQIGSTLSKILAILIINRMKSWYEKQLLDQQQGFRSGRGTSDGIYIIKRVQQITNKMKKPCYALFIDLTAAFDKVNRKMMFRAISNRLSSHAEQKLIQVLESLYSYTTSALDVTPDKAFEITVGVRQGGPESPVLFNLFIDFVMRVYLDKCKQLGIKFLRLNYKIPATANILNRSMVGTQTIDWLGYADDLVLLFEDAKNLRLGLETIYSTFKNYELCLNVPKTKTMILNYPDTENDYPNTIAHLNKTPIENVKSFKYLGCILTYDEPSTGNPELDMRIDAAHCKFYELGKNFMNQRIGLVTRVKVFNALVRSRLTYSCQTWTLTKKQTSRMNAAYVSLLRRMVRGGFARKEGTYHYELTNSDIIKKCETEDIHAFMARQQRNFAAHIIRGDDRRITKRLLFNNDVTRKPGRSNTLYKTVIENERKTPNEFNMNALSRVF